MSKHYKQKQNIWPLLFLNINLSPRVILMQVAYSMSACSICQSEKVIWMIFNHLNIFFFKKLFYFNIYCNNETCFYFLFFEIKKMPSACNIGLEFFTFVPGNCLLSRRRVNQNLLSKVNILMIQGKLWQSYNQEDDTTRFAESRLSPPPLTHIGSVSG